MYLDSKLKHNIYVSLGGNAQAETTFAPHKQALHTRKLDMIRRHRVFQIVQHFSHICLNILHNKYR